MALLSNSKTVRSSFEPLLVTTRPSGSIQPNVERPLPEGHNLWKAPGLITLLNKLVYAPVNKRITSISDSCELTLFSAHSLETLVATVAGDKLCPQFLRANGLFSGLIELQTSGGTIPTPVAAAPAISFGASSAGRNYELICFVDHAAFVTQSIVFVSVSQSQVRLMRR